MSYKIPSKLASIEAAVHVAGVVSCWRSSKRYWLPRYVLGSMPSPWLSLSMEFLQWSPTNIRMHRPHTVLSVRDMWSSRLLFNSPTLRYVLLGKSWGRKASDTFRRQDRPRTKDIAVLPSASAFSYGECNSRPAGIRTLSS